jgi:quinol monooxygenase YgiN
MFLCPNYVFVTIRCMRYFKSIILIGKTLTGPLIVLSGLLALDTGCKPSMEKTDPIETMKNLQQSGELVVRFAKLEIDTAKLEEYKAFLKEGIETSIAREPGVLTMYAVQEEADPSKITVLEIYASDSAYQSHLATAHFQMYKTGTLEMVKSLELIDLDPTDVPYDSENPLYEFGYGLKY